MGDRGRELTHGGDAAGVGQLRLSFAIAALAVACFGFRPLALGDVVEKNTDESALGVFDPEGVNVVPASELFGFIFKAHRLAREGDPAVNLEPMFFVLWRDFAHPSAGGIVDPRLPVKRRADFQKTIIDRLFVLVKQNFDRANTLVNRFEQHAVILFRLAQLHLGALALSQIEHKGDALVAGSVESRRADKDGHAAAVVPQVLLLVSFAASRRPELCDRPFVSVLPFGRRKVGPAQATRNDIVAAMSHYVEKSLIGLNNATIKVKN